MHFNTNLVSSDKNKLYHELSNQVATLRLMEKRLQLVMESETEPPLSHTGGGEKQGVLEGILTLMKRGVESGTEAMEYREGMKEKNGIQEMIQQQMKGKNKGEKK